MLLPTLIGFAAVVAAGPPGDARRGQLTQQVHRYLNEPDYPTFSKALRGWKGLPAGDRMALVDFLARHLMSTDKPGVKNPQDLHIAYREKTGDLKPISFEGHYVDQDLFLVGGKAAWAIGELIGVRLPEINEGQTKEDRAARVEDIRSHAYAHTSVAAYLAEPDYPTLRRTLRGWQGRPVRDRVRVLELLVPRLMSTEKPGLKNPQDVLIPYRRRTGELKNTGGGGTVEQDLFIAGGRAAWAVEQLLGVRLPEINDGLSDADLEDRDHVIRLCVEAYKAGVEHASTPPKK